MKKYLIILTLGSIFAGIAACTKESNDPTPIRPDADKADVQWFNATLLSPARNFIFVNGAPANGGSVAYGTLFPSSSYAFTVFGGTTAITIRDTATVSTQLQQQFMYNFEAGKSYTIFTYDTITAPKRLIVENKIEVPTDGTGRVRFANFVYDRNPIPAIDIFSKRTGTNIFTAVPTATVSDFISLPPITDTLIVRPTGSTTINLDTLNGFRPMSGRSYTLIFRGRYITNEIGGAVNPRVLSSFANN